MHVRQSSIPKEGFTLCANPEQDFTQDTNWLRYSAKCIYDVHSQLHPVMDVMRSAQPSSACGLQKKNGASVWAKSY